MNALSEWLEAEPNHDGENTMIQRFERGKPAYPLRFLRKSNQTGTKVTFKPDPEIFEETVFEYDTLLFWLREQAFLNAGLRINLIDRRGPEPVLADLCYEGGISSFVAYLNKSKGILHDVISISGEKDGSIAEIALQYNTTYNENILSFANNINTVDGGMHELGFKNALTKVINDYARKHNYLKADDKNLAGEDVREGLTAIISVKLENPQFEGQTKTKLGNSEIRALVEGIIHEKLADYLRKTRPSQEIF